MKPNKTCFLPSHIVTFGVSNIWVVRWKNHLQCPILPKAAVEE